MATEEQHLATVVDLYPQEEEEPLQEVVPAAEWKPMGYLRPCIAFTCGACGHSTSKQDCEQGPACPGGFQVLATCPSCGVSNKFFREGQGYLAASGSFKQ